MSAYDLRFTVGIDQQSRTNFYKSLKNLTSPRTIEFKFDDSQIESFKQKLATGLETTIKFHVDTSEVENAIRKYNITNYNNVKSIDDIISEKTNASYGKQIERYKALIQEYQKVEKDVVKYGRQVMEDAGASRWDKTLLEKTEVPEIDKVIDKYIKAEEKIKTLREQIRSELVTLQDDPKFLNEGILKRFRSLPNFDDSILSRNIGEFFDIGYEDKSLEDYKNKFKQLRAELQAFTQERHIGSPVDIDKLSIDELAEAVSLLQQMENINKRIVELNGGKKTTQMRLGDSKEQTALFKYYEEALQAQNKTNHQIMGLFNSQSTNATATVSSSATAELAKTLEGGLNNIPINSFLVSPDAITAVRESIESQLKNITISTVLNTNQNSAESTTEGALVLPSAVIESVTLSENAVQKLRNDVQNILNNSTLEPKADETAFTEAFERASKTYQNKLNKLGRTITKAINKPTIEEFDARPAIEKMKAQINKELKSFKFDINGKVAHGTISTGLNEEYQYAYKTYESLESAVGSMTKKTNANIAKLTGWGSTAGSSETLSKYNAFLSKVEQFKNEFRQTDADGKLVMPLDEANKKMAELVAESHKLNDSFDQIATRNSIEKTLSNTENSVRATLKELDKYQQTEAVKNIRVGISGDENSAGILNEIETLKTKLPTLSLSEANMEMMKLLTKVGQLNQEFAEIGVNTPLTKELERAEGDAINLERKLLSLQERMQKALSANSRGFSQEVYRSRYNQLYRATQSNDLDADGIKAIDTRFKELMRDMRDAGMVGKSFGDIMRNMYAKFGSWTMVTMTIQRVIMTFKRMVAAVQDVDSALTNLKKVTTATEGDLNRFMKSVGDSAYKMGSSISDLINATAEFSRLGYDLNQAQKLGELATMYKTVAEDLDITTASQSIVSTLKAFEKTGVSAKRIVDVFNYVGNNFAISSAGIGEAMQRSAASLQTANNDLEHSVALITAANEVAQDPIQVGTAMKTLAARIRGSKSELVELGEDIEFISEGTSKLRNEIKALSGVDIMVDDQTFKSTYQIMDELSVAYQGMVETSQARLTELIGGKNQANIVSALLENFDTARKVLADATSEADGSAERELATALDSINGKIQQLSATWQKFSTDVLESESFKTIIDGANKFLQILDSLIGDSNALIKLAPMVLAGFGIAKNKNGLGEPENQRVPIICPEFMSHINNRLCAA